MLAIPEGYPASPLEAFAFLETRTRLSIDDLKVLALIEQSGLELYMAMARVAPGAEASDLLQSNAREELGHAHRMLKALHLLGGSFSLPEMNENPYATPLCCDRLDAGLLKQLAEGEKNGEAIYGKWADNEQNPEVARLYRLNGSDEAGHGRRILQVLALMQAD